MHGVDLTVDPALDASLSRWEEHGRPSLPVSGFVLERRPGAQHRGVYDAQTGAAVFETSEHVLRTAPSPDRQHVALQLAESADEDGYLAVVDVASGRVSRHPDVRCRYDPMRWTADSCAVELVAQHPRSLVRLDVRLGTVSTDVTVDVDPQARVRLFPAGPDGMLVETRAGFPTRLVDRRTGTCLGSFPAVVSVADLGQDVLVQGRRTLVLVDPRTGAQRWSWHDPRVQITSSTVTGTAVHLAAVRDGRSVLLTVVHGELVDEWPVVWRGSVATVTEIAAAGTALRALVESPTSPPQVLDVHDLRTADQGAARSAGATPDPPGATTTWHEVRADDGVVLTVVVTSPTTASGPAPLLLSCYGGFDVADLPVFEPTIPAWVESGGRYATAHVRGGGEHGSRWRDAGTGREKRRGIEDLTCIARWLVAGGLTRPDLLVLVGASHGGVLVTSCALGAPDLCAGVVSTAAPLDLLTLEMHPLGSAWTREFGDPSTPAGLDELRSISPLYRAESWPDGVVPPAFLGIVLDEDSRVDALATHAVTAALRAKGGSALTWSAPQTGHGSNHLDSLHRLGATVLSCAATMTRRTPPPLEGPRLS